AEDGIRDRTVTGVQTCALPISLTTAWPSSRTTWAARRRCRRWTAPSRSRGPGGAGTSNNYGVDIEGGGLLTTSGAGVIRLSGSRSEERRVGKEGGAGGERGRGE